MQADGLESCPACARHVRRGERACPFCGAAVQFFVSVPAYRLKTPLRRSQSRAFGAALAAAGVAFACESTNAVAIYGAPFEPVDAAGSGGTHPSGGAPAAGTGGTAAGHPSGGAPSAGNGGRSGNSGEGGDAQGGAAP
jgi:hypothetical protein